MADGRDKNNLSRSPNENFNPLDPDRDQGEDKEYQHSPRDNQYIDNDSETDEDPDPDTPQFSTTPPVNFRVRKREKSRQQYKEAKEKLDLKRRPKPRNVVSLIKEEYFANSLNKISGTDSEDNIERDGFREKKDKRKKEKEKKQLSKSRSHERLEKRSSDFLSNKVSAGMPRLKIEMPKRVSLPTIPNTIVTCTTPTFKNRLRREVSLPLECSEDRQAFSNIFSTLVKLEKKEKNFLSQARMKRQMSTEQEIQQNETNRDMWLELQAEINGKSKDDILKERAKIEDVLHLIMDFKLNCLQHEVTNGNSSDPFLDAGEEPKICYQLSTSVSDSFQAISLSSETIDCQKDALVKVEALLHKLDKCERLYPTTKSFNEANDLYASETFGHRVKSLILWLNITRDLCHRINLLGKILGVRNTPGLDWPVIDYESPRSSSSGTLERNLPVIQQTSASSTEDSDGDDNNDTETIIEDTNDESLGHTKKVTFSISGGSSGRSSCAPSPNPESNIPNDVSEVLNETNVSTPLKNIRSSIGSYAPSLSRAASDASIDDANMMSSAYRHFVDKSLKKTGMNRLLVRLRTLLDRSLQRAREALERPKSALSYAEILKSSRSSDKVQEVASSPSLDLSSVINNAALCNRSSSLAEHGAWSEEFIKMGLPSFRPSYLFLVRIPLDVIHECLRLRLEQRPTNEPSLHSTRQLMRECKEVLKGAVAVKQYYQLMVASVMWDEQEMDDKFASDLEQFDVDMQAILEVYFSYLQSWMNHVQNLDEASLSLKNYLVVEWTFTKQICPYIIGGEAEAGKRFSMLAISLLNSITDLLYDNIDEITRQLFDMTKNENIDEEETNDDEQSNRDKASDYRHCLQQTCRGFKNLFNEARERASKALGFAKMLRNDLEIAADFNVTVSTKQLLDKLQLTNHVRVMAPVSAGYLMFIPDRITSNKELILQLLNVTCGREESTLPPDLENNNGYLVMVRCEGTADHVLECPIWNGDVLEVAPTAETAIALSHIEVEALLVVVIHSSQLGDMRKEFDKKMGESVELVNEQTSCHQAIAESLAEIKTIAVQLREKVARAIEQVDETLNFDEILQHEENDRNHLVKIYRETMLQGYNFGFEVGKDISRLVSGEQRQKMVPGLVSFAKYWMKFVMEKCETGRGGRPRWAVPGFDYLTVVCDPKVLACLSDESFKELQKNIHNCINHIIGSPELRTPQSPTHLGQHMTHRLPSWPSTAGQPFRRSVSSRSMPAEVGNQSGLSTPSTPSPVNMDMSLSNGQSSPLSRSDRIMSLISRIDEKRNQVLQDRHMIGKVTSLKASDIDYRISVRRVNFKWQRGIKIGEGQFGKVYSAVNVDNGILMAMKELKFLPSDQQEFKAIADEIRNFEGTSHPNLVSYYGVEIHKDEMLIFMEFCDRGTIEEAAKLGLPEELIRRYIRYILIAVQYLHDKGIIHRDIKGANIFLTSDGILKLGDFGASVKLKNLTTMPGEGVSLTGTTAYMAPEVITQSKEYGHGRSADIWSVGCVVIEMSTGKRPWFELENNFQIMFKVGMGEKPAIPEQLSAEGKDFLSHCFETDPNDRWTASKLQDHNFTKIYDEAEGITDVQF
ncbi:hypothetical protein LOTGIDRAFT_168212 [Lottia gigantea]|uniref:Protein kinase domain-containing protein n=1 Tax=Lottia gigantea TaxID=225164 RepID=V3ZVK0_LOTGI|nr:hypothetical protein LOTGIDRAFT_168212 [Lottia gigantea]ESO84956.1 hypothetical protein LOTGIDRAFT_168212 [Lottia gigantea]